MKKIILFSLLLTLSSLILFGQKTNDIITLKVGYSSTNIVFKEAFEPSINIFGFIFNTGKTFVGDGPEFGISKEFNSRMYLDLSFSIFSGRDTKAKVNNNENYYTLKGFQGPLTINYLFRDSTKKLRINLGAGVQHLKGHLQQFETTSSGSAQVTNQLTNINISELQLALRPGIQFRVIPNLFTSFIVTVSVSTKGRYSDHPCLFLKYTFLPRRVSSNLNTISF